MKQFLKEEFDRLLSMIPEIDPTTEEYNTLLNSLEHLGMLSEFIETLLDEISIVDVRIITPPITPIQSVCNGDCAGCDECSTNCSETADAGENQTEPDPEPAAPAQISSEEEPSISDEEPEPKAYTYVEVRQALVSAKKKGVDVKSLLQEYGAEGIKDLDPENYPAVMSRLEAN